MNSFDRRGFLGLTGLAAGAVALSACGSNSSSGTPSSSASGSPSASTSGSVASAGAITIWIDSNRQPVLKPLASQFKTDTGVTVNLVVKDFSKIPDDFITQAPTGKGPDAIIAPHDATGRLVQNGVVAPIELGDASQYLDVAVQGFTYQGKVYGVPISIENIAIIRNTALASSPTPSTYDAMITAGKAVVSSGKAKYAFLCGLDPKTANAYTTYPFQTSFGAPVFATASDGSYDATKLAMQGANGEKFAAWLKAQGAAKILNLNITSDISKGQFLAGASPFFITGPWDLPDIKAKGLKYAIEAIPSAGGQTAAPFVGVQGFLMSAKSTNPVATQKFLVEYLGSEKVQTDLFKVGLRAPANKAAYQAAQSDKDVAAFGAVGEKGVPMPNVPAMAQVWSDWGTTEAQLISGKAADSAKAWQAMCTTIAGKIKSGS